MHMYAYLCSFPLTCHHFILANTFYSLCKAKLSTESWLFWWKFCIGTAPIIRHHCLFWFNAIRIPVKNSNHWTFQNRWAVPWNSTHVCRNEHLLSDFVTCKWITAQGFHIWKNRDSFSTRKFVFIGQITWWN